MNDQENLLQIPRIFITARMHAVLTQGSPIKVRVFQDRKEAAQWLGVPLELLSAKGASGKRFGKEIRHKKKT